MSLSNSRRAHIHSYNRVLIYVYATSGGPAIPIQALSLTKAALLIAILAASNSALSAHKGNSAGTEQPTAHLLTRVQGRALVNFALQHDLAPERGMIDQTTDCSHLVHQIFSDAGLIYPYAPSSEIFAGIPEFQRVRHAQAGDLIVWPGHVGLVVDPKRATFFSSTGSGPRTDEYTSDYWRHRGYPRFYRYLVTATTQLAAHRLRKP